MGSVLTTDRHADVTDLFVMQPTQDFLNLLTREKLSSSRLLMVRRRNIKAGLEGDGGTEASG